MRGSEAIRLLHTPAWVDPIPLETIPSYAARLARLLDPGCPCIVGGASFGGIIALEMATHLRCETCVLISSVRSPMQLPWWYRLLRPVTLMSPNGLGWLAGRVAAVSAPSLPRSTARQLRRLSEPNAAFVRWASWAVLHWHPSAGIRKVRVLQIHGDLDRTIPVRCTRPDVVVPGGGHLLTLTHPKIVNEFLFRAIALPRTFQRNRGITPRSSA